MLTDSIVRVDRASIDKILAATFGGERKYMNYAVGSRIERIITDAEENHDHEFFGVHARFNEICEVLRVSFGTEHSESHRIACEILRTLGVGHMIDPECV